VLNKVHATTAQILKDALVYPYTATLRHKTHLWCIHAWSMKHVQCAANGKWTHFVCHLVAAQRKSLTCSLITASKQVRACNGLVSEQFSACLEAQWQGNAMGSFRNHARESLLQQMPIPDTMKVLAQPMSSMRS